MLEAKFPPLRPVAHEPIEPRIRPLSLLCSFDFFPASRAVVKAAWLRGLARRYFSILIQPIPAATSCCSSFCSAATAAPGLLERRPNRRYSQLYLVALVGAFAVLERYELVKLALPSRLLELNLEIVGLSYILFRQLHFLVDMTQGQIERPSLWAYLNYQLNPFTLLAGPIQRFQDFQAYWQNPVPSLLDRHEILKACLRVFVGIIKIAVIGAVFHAGYERLLLRLDGGSPALAERVEIACYIRPYALLLRILSLLEFLGVLRRRDSRRELLRAQAA